MLSVADALTDPCMQHAELIAGHNGLQRPLRWVHSAEVLHIANLLEGGELLLTTGMSLARATAQTQTHYLRSLAAGNISALAFELVTSFGELPSLFPQWAKKSGIPLIVFRREVSFSAIEHRLAQRIFAQDTTPIFPPGTDAHAPASDENAYVWACSELAPLLRLPDKKRLRLMETLHVLLQLHFNMSKAARALGLRRQSLYYRYAQLEDLVGDLRGNPELGGRLLTALNRYPRDVFLTLCPLSTPHARSRLAFNPEASAVAITADESLPHPSYFHLAPGDLTYG
ncbi:PucR family transcriptional regulator ligand-binding domain-containing protein [Acidihalobacter ferrooxydans]|uniref:PucR family transcriptional regulator n=1 Tax=Acidihalobacter ferrooxydans TaxID=1765967 RepID=A0A1P8UGG0_9GAMM|nr:PucR family transcriptional regulator ligand-binding domain-containing protein [Acidihalobacter ferrooxydans]APZ42937.1 hypothetical protein BW247_07400 [Acidihalobacter ferrooxydans]